LKIDKDISRTNEFDLFLGLSNAYKMTKKLKQIHYYISEYLYLLPIVDELDSEKKKNSPLFE